MQIIAQCPSCGNCWLMGPETADRRITCSECGIIFKVPKLDEVPRAARIIKQAKTNLFVDEDGKIYG
ncbi:MAG: hypothetical protein ACYSSP_11200 [Planctomycetota bacterium]